MDFLPYPHVLNTWGPAVILIWKEVETLEPGAWLEEVGYWGMFFEVYTLSLAFLDL